MEMIGRSDHDQVEGTVFEKRCGVGVGLAGIEIAFLQDWNSDGHGVGIAGYGEREVHVLHGTQHMGYALAKTDDADADAFHEERLAPRGAESYSAAMAGCCGPGANSTVSIVLPRFTIFSVEIAMSFRSPSACAKWRVSFSTRSSRRWTSWSKRPTSRWITVACSRIRASF